MGFGLLVAGYLFELTFWWLGRIVLAVVASGGVLGAVLVIWPDSPANHRKSARATTAVLAGAVGIGFTSLAVAWLPPGFHGLTAELHRIGVPAGWNSKGEALAGSVICFDECPSAYVELLPPYSDPDRTAAAMATLLRAKGYRRVAGPAGTGTRYRRGNFKITYSYDDGVSVYDGVPSSAPRWNLEIEAWPGY